MSIRNIALSRKVTSYGKVQAVISRIIRTHELFINRKRIRPLRYLNIGCGENTFPQFINLDYNWRPGVNICWDITKKRYPLSDGSVQGVYTEHCLEHIPLAAGERNMREFHRLLRPGGNIRIVVPDAELYFTIYVRKLEGQRVSMPYEENYISPAARINSLFRSYGHQFIYDYETLHYLLEKAGFRDIRKETFMHGRDRNLLIDTEWRKTESLYVEATR